MFSKGRHLPDRIQELTLADKSVSIADLTQIINSQLFSTGEKLEIICVMCGIKSSSEVYKQIRYQFDKSSALEIPNKKDLSIIQKELINSKLLFLKREFMKLNKNTQKIRKFTWFQICANDAVKVLYEKYADTISEYEEGVIYGFPTTAIRAFAGLEESHVPKIDHPALYYFGGVYSRSNWKNERKEYLRWWQKIKNLSPDIIQIAKREFEEIYSNN